MAYVLKIQSKKYLLLDLNVEVGKGVNDGGKLFLFFNLKLSAITLFQEAICTSVYQLRSFSRQNRLLHGFFFTQSKLQLPKII